MSTDYQPPEKSQVPAYRQALENLIQSDGWRLYSAMLRNTQAQKLLAVGKATDPNELLRISGAVEQLTWFAAWPEQQIKAFLQQEKTWAEEAKKEKRHG